MPDVAFDLPLEHGRCVGVRIPAAPALDELAATLPLEERQIAANLGPRRRGTWVGGRAAVHEALTRLGVAGVAVLSDPRGAPVLPEGVAGSITHKDTLAAALVARESDARVGVDLETDFPRTIDLAPRILTDAESAALGDLDPEARAREVLLRFSAKEAVYKALDPFVRRYVGFKEVSVWTRPDGGAEVEPHLPAHEGPFVIEVTWRRLDGVVLTTARVARR